MRGLNYLIATCCGAGSAPVAPGTAGAAVGLALVLLLFKLPVLYWTITAALFFLGVRASSEAERTLGERDPSRVVIDEAVSMLVTFFFLPLSVSTVIIGFLLNRFLDIVKPFPAGRLQRCRGGWGVMLDDLVAGIYANLLLRIVWIGWMRG